MITIQNTRDNSLSKNSLTLIVNNAGVQQMKTSNINSVENSEISEIRVGDRSGGGSFGTLFLIVRIKSVGDKTEENVIVNENLLTFKILGVQGLDVLIHNTLSSLGGSFNEIGVNLQQSFISIQSLDQILLGEVSANLKFFVPISDTAGVKTVQIQQESLGSRGIGFISSGGLVAGASEPFNFKSVEIQGLGVDVFFLDISVDERFKALLALSTGAGDQVQEIEENSVVLRSGVVDSSGGVVDVETSLTTGDLVVKTF